MKIFTALGLAALFSITACGGKPDVTGDTVTVPTAETKEVATTATNNTCSEYSSDYTIAYAYGETALPEGQQEALDTGFEKLLPIVTECGNFHVTLVSTTADNETNALERASIIQKVFTDSYFVPQNLIAIETAEPDILSAPTSDNPLDALKPEVTIKLRVMNTSD